MASLAGSHSNASLLSLDTPMEDIPEDERPPSILSPSNTNKDRCTNNSRGSATPNKTHHWLIPLSVYQVNRGVDQRAPLQRGSHHRAQRREDNAHAEGGRAGGTSWGAVFISAAEGQGCGGMDACYFCSKEACSEYLSISSFYYYCIPLDPHVVSGQTSILVGGSWSSISDIPQIYLNSYSCRSH